MTAPPRRGPRPLALHLSLLAARRGAALASLPNCWSGSPPSNIAWPPMRPGPARERARIEAALAAAATPPEAFAAAVWRALNAEDAALLAGIRAYRAHPWAPRAAAVPAIWAEGSSRLLDYGPPEGLPTLVVPSLVNRAHVLDLLPDVSMLRALSAGGLRPLLLDWGAPGAVERGFTLTDYVAGRLERALGAIGRPVLLAGYCMGGLLALAAAQRRPDRVRGLVLLATPWDFWAAGAAGPRALAGLLPGLEPLLAATGALPVDALQSLFAALDPTAIAARYRTLAGLATPDPGPRGRHLLALEDWLNDGVPLAAPVAREVIGGWYGQNTPARGGWRVAGEAVAPAALRLPSFVALPARDRVVPPASAAALARLIPGAVAHPAAAGHIGMVAGAGAAAALWRPLLGWVRDSVTSGVLVAGGGAGPHSPRHRRRGPGRTPRPAD